MSIVKIKRYQYDPNDCLGRGSFAEVYKGFRDDGIPVAIKRILKSRLKRPNNRRLLEQEISILKKVDHANIIQLYDSLETTSDICLVLEFCDGGDLAQYINEFAPMPEELIAFITKQLASALRHLRQFQIVHRDLKPHNVLLHGDRQAPKIKLADFGFARFLQDDDLTATFCGSPLYMAPEVLEGDEYGAQADLWSVGVILYSCLTGKPPFQAPNIKALKLKLKKHKTLKLPPTASPQISDLLVGLLQVDPGKRLSFDQFFMHPFFQLASSIDDQMVLQLAEASEGVESVVQSQEAVAGSSYVMVDNDAVKMEMLADIAQGVLPMDALKSESVMMQSSMASSSTFQTVEGFLQLVEDIVRPALILTIYSKRRLNKRFPEVVPAKVPSSDPEARKQAEALILFAKAMNVFRAALRKARRILQVKPFLLEDQRVKIAIERLRDHFNGCLKSLDVLNELGAIDHAQNYPDLQTAEEIIFEYCLSLCRAAAEDEKHVSSKNQLDNIIGLYQRAVVLLELLLRDCNPDDRKILMRYFQGARHRVEVLQHRNLDSSPFSAQHDTGHRVTTPIGIPLTPEMRRKRHHSERASDSTKEVVTRQQSSSYPPQTQLPSPKSSGQNTPLHSKASTPPEPTKHFISAFNSMASTPPDRPNVGHGRHDSISSNDSLHLSLDTL